MDALKKDAPKKMVSIWTWSALILAVYGLLLLGGAVFRLATGETPRVELASLHADVWWPCAMLVVAGLLFWAGRVEERG